MKNYIKITPDNSFYRNYIFDDLLLIEEIYLPIIQKLDFDSSSIYIEIRDTEANYIDFVDYIINYISLSRDWRLGKDYDIELILNNSNNLSIKDKDAFWSYLSKIIYRGILFDFKIYCIDRFDLLKIKDILSSYNIEFSLNYDRACIEANFKKTNQNYIDDSLRSLTQIYIKIKKVVNNEFSIFIFNKILYFLGGKDDKVFQN